MKSLKLKSLAIAFVATMGVAGSANAAISTITAEGNSNSVEASTNIATRMLEHKCGFLFGTLLGEPEVVSVVGYTVILKQDCNH